MKKILIANRGEIAGRISEACAALGIASVAVHAADDVDAFHLALADEAVALPVAETGTPYLDAAALVDAAVEVGADAIHPGYGFLSESADFAALVEARGLVFIGPRPETLALLGDKVGARRAAIDAGVPVVPGSGGPVQGAEQVAEFGAVHGWPILVKAAHGGGGRGMRVMRSESEVDEAWQAAGREALAAFGDATLFLERYIESARHIEIQIIADTHGNVVAVGDRDCSVQRRHQKLIEEAPAAAITPEVRAAMADAAVRLCAAANYRGVGTVEFLLDGEEFWFLEVNGRIQVEHPVTELVTGVDLVAEQIRIAAGGHVSIGSTPEPRGHAIQVRVNAEDPARGFLPVPGALETLEVPQWVGVRFDVGYRPGDTISPRYDSLIGKLIVWGADREQAIRRLLRTIAQSRVTGVPTTLPAASAVLGANEFRNVEVTTRWFETQIEPLLALEETPEPESGDDEDDGWVDVAGCLIRIPPPAGAPAPAIDARRTKHRARGAAHGRSGHAGEVVAPMAGTVLAVHVTEGATVQSGDALVTLEAMKMENVVRASTEATVAKVQVKLGATVELGSPLVALEPATH